MKKTEKEEKTLKRSVTKQLPCKLTDAEILAYGRDLARAHSDMSRIDDEFASQKQEFKFRADEQKAIIGKLSARVHSGQETRDVECVETKNWSRSIVTITRTDTKEEIENRPMREDEKQMQLTQIDPGNQSGDGEKT